MVAPLGRGENIVPLQIHIVIVDENLVNVCRGDLVVDGYRDMMVFHRQVDHIGEIGRWDRG